jgi:hypothetical protein
VFVVATACNPHGTRFFGRVCKKIIDLEFGLVYENRSELIAFCGLEYHKPDVISRKLDVAKQKAFIQSRCKIVDRD